MTVLTQFGSAISKLLTLLLCMNQQVDRETRTWTNPLQFSILIRLNLFFIQFDRRYRARVQRKELGDHGERADHSEWPGVHSGRRRSSKTGGLSALVQQSARSDVTTSDLQAVHGGQFGSGFRACRRRYGRSKCGCLDRHHLRGLSWDWAAWGSREDRWQSDACNLC